MQLEELEQAVLHFQERHTESEQLSQLYHMFGDPDSRQEDPGSLFAGVDDGSKGDSVRTYLELIHSIFTASEDASRSEFILEKLIRVLTAIPSVAEHVVPAAMAHTPEDMHHVDMLVSIVLAALGPELCQGRSDKIAAAGTTLLLGLLGAIEASPAKLDIVRHMMNTSQPAALLTVLVGTTSRHYGRMCKTVLFLPAVAKLLVVFEDPLPGEDFHARFGQVRDMLRALRTPILANEAAGTHARFQLLVICTYLLIHHRDRDMLAEELLAPLIYELQNATRLSSATTKVTRLPLMTGLVPNEILAALNTAGTTKPVMRDVAIAALDAAARSWMSDRERHAATGGIGKRDPVAEYAEHCGATAESPWGDVLPGMASLAAAGDIVSPFVGRPNFITRQFVMSKSVVHLRASMADLKDFTVSQDKVTRALRYIRHLLIFTEAMAPERHTVAERLLRVVAEHERVAPVAVDTFKVLVAVTPVPDVVAIISGWLSEGDPARLPAAVTLAAVAVELWRQTLGPALDAAMRPMVASTASMMAEHEGTAVIEAVDALLFAILETGAVTTGSEAIDLASCCLIVRSHPEITPKVGPAVDVVRAAATSVVQRHLADTLWDPTEGRTLVAAVDRLVRDGYCPSVEVDALTAWVDRAIARVTDAKTEPAGSAAMGLAVRLTALIVAIIDQTPAVLPGRVEALYGTGEDEGRGLAAWRAGFADGIVHLLGLAGRVESALTPDQACQVTRVLVANLTDVDKPATRRTAMRSLLALAEANRTAALDSEARIDLLNAMDARLDDSIEEVAVQACRVIHTEGDAGRIPDAVKGNLKERLGIIRRSHAVGRGDLAEQAEATLKLLQHEL